MSMSRALPVFSVAFAVLYVLSMDNNWALFTYLPRSGEFHALVFLPPTPRAGPAMYWYGWLATSAIGAAVAGAAASWAPANWAGRRWSALTWAVPLVVILVIVYILRSWFIRVA
jgi:hypothetical protein